MAVYLGNPSAHNLSALTHASAMLRVLGSQNVYTASTVDQMPKQVSAGHMFGTMLSVPVPDVDRCDHLLMLGLGSRTAPARWCARPPAPSRRPWR